MRTQILLAGIAVLGLAACTSNSDGADTVPVSVTSSDTACDVAPTTATAGTIVFSVKNTGTKPTEFYLLGTDDSVVGEVEDIGPGVARDLVLDIQAGSYFTACKPGMTGDGIRGQFTVTQ
jgi:iron uptake system component EfeO